MDASASEPASCPVAGCRLPVDIFLQSSDGILTGAHTRNLETFGEAFPSSSLAAPPSEPIVLDEPADVLQLLMHFMHLIPQPSLEGRSFELVLRFAEAVDKYGVHAADQLCWLKMRDHAETNSLEVLQYAARLNLYDLLDIAAPHTLRYTFSEIARSISDHDLLVRWAIYSDHWAIVQRCCLDPPPQDTQYFSAYACSHIDYEGDFVEGDCARFLRFQIAVSREMQSQGPSTLLRPRKHFDDYTYITSSCDACSLVIEEWLKIMKDLVDNAKRRGFPKTIDSW